MVKYRPIQIGTRRRESVQAESILGLDCSLGDMNCIGHKTLLIPVE